LHKKFEDAVANAVLVVVVVVVVAAQQQAAATWGVSQVNRAYA